jgi:uncharacterized protein with HEPN domain
MDLEIQKWLYDILVSINSVNEFVGDVRIFEAYESDKKTRRSVEREIMIIGEAVNRITSADPTIEITNAKQIIATRNRVVHAYDAVDNAMIWNIVINHLPNLKSEIEQLIIL